MPEHEGPSAEELGIVASPSKIVNEIEHPIEAPDTTVKQRLAGMFMKSINDDERAGDSLPKLESAEALQNLLDSITEEELSTNRKLGWIRYSYNRKYTRSDQVRELLNDFPDANLETILFDPSIDDGERPFSDFLEPDIVERRNQAADVWAQDIMNKLCARFDAYPEIASLPNKEAAVWTLLGLRERYDEVLRRNQAKREFIAQLSAEISEKPEVAVPSETLNDELLAEQVGIRDRILEELFEFKKERPQDRTFHMVIGDVLRRGEYAPVRGLDHERVFAEQEIAYAGLVLSPTLSTQDFLAVFGSISDKLYDYIPESTDFMGMFSPSLAESFYYHGLAQAVQEGKLNGWQGKTIFEIGGKKGSESIARLGATLAGQSDAGHSGYTATYHAGSREAMIDIANYKNSGEPHSIDMICSSRLFDMGSGIDKIAEVEGRGDTQELAEYEMTLVMNNLLKPNGFMIHYDHGLPMDFAEKVGDTEVCSTKSRAIIYRFRDTDIERTGTIKLGKKRVDFDQESRTWELINEVA